MLETSINPLVPSFLEEVFKMLDMGGPVMFILLLMSIFGLSVFIYKLIQFQFSQIHSFKNIDTAFSEWKNGHSQTAYLRLKKSRNPAARVLESAFIGVQKNFDPALIREEVSRIANVHISRLRSHFRSLEVIASLSPLLGLFGTVLGIINAFHELEKAGSSIDPSMLSGGIWVALLTTAAGLAVAMPAVAGLNWLEARLDNFTHLTENAVTQVFTYALAVPQNFSPETSQKLSQDMSENTSIDFSSPLAEYPQA